MKLEKIVNFIVQRVGISESQARTAVDTVASFLKNRLPPGMAGKVDKFLKGGGESAGGVSGNGR